MVRRVMICLGTLGILATSAISVEAATDLRSVDSAALGTSRSLPWSEPVQINDPFEGNFVGVFDRNYFYGRFLNTTTRIEVQSLWSPESVRFLLVTRDRDCLSQPFHYGLSSDLGCSEFNNARNITELFIRINDQVFQVSGQNSTFPVSSELAQALQTAPQGNVSIRLVTESGETIDSEIGQETVEAWRTVYTPQTDNVSSNKLNVR
ncbi:hypothetical protein H6F93_02460 [Leptolyngbya sp. FACHB-671]|uniref:hypothetical protein n=1 Tax=Leptolyngbya sp. FACHB-671 TaxID=2692812 RepID=UPI001685A829|nr:hypothetical protein [Leptolyngbya sp. FACHB-671]MBD2066399.1 hypothetical protein [Leptolyngbya sp. FACHB-671]